MSKQEKITIQLVSTSDPYTSLKSGDVGTKVGEYIDPWGCRTIMVDWENGSNLSLIEGSGDSWREIKESVNEQVS